MTAHAPAPSPSPVWTAFEAAVKELRAIEQLDALAGWDQETYMPTRGAEARADARARVRALWHERLTGVRLGDLLAQAAALPGLSVREQALVRVVERDRQRESKVPVELVEAIARAQGLGVEAWKRARGGQGFQAFRPFLETLVGLRRQESDARGFEGDRYDALLGNFEPGLRTERLVPVLERFRDALVPMVQEVCARPPVRDDFITRDAYDTDAQYEFSLELLRGIGFDLEAGRLDRSVHPFCSGQNPHDVRLTTRLFRDDACNGLFSALHEGGHGLYEQGLPADGTPLGTAASMALHESQSRLWENIVGRSMAFWMHWYPRLQARFPQALGDVSLEAWVRGINRVRRSLIRVDADECTYNLHILVRFELERALLSGDLAVADLPAAWNERYARIVGVTPPDDKTGVMQDIHWAWGEFGYFPTYTLGNMYAASLARAAEAQIPGLWTRISEGDTAPLLTWLRQKVHAHGRSLDAEDIVRQATGAGLTEVDLVSYLRRKYVDGQV